DGLHFEVGDARALARVLRRFVDEPGLALELSRDFPRVKTVEEDAAEMEFRYRGLAAQRRDARARTWLDCRGIDAARREGQVDVQGAEMLLLRPDGGAIEFDLAPAAGGKREIEVQVYGLGAEKRVELGGRVLIDHAEIGRIAPFSSAGKDGVRSFVFEADVPRGASSLRLESRTAAGARAVFLRVQRVIVRDAPPAKLAGAREAPAEVRA
ncbi:MAG TPA: hypothetical protein VM509_07780, partial [Planctomycetota bacterium]|nr:hypothetical protein [Planctomycetota bacterium]